MGVLFSKSTKKSNIFKVVNLNEDGSEFLPGKIEITDDFILLHQKRKNSISWPIRTLRRYGYETNVFSFEAGRRCPTGEGIFAFRCEQAEMLFLLLQANIQRNSGVNVSAANQSSDSESGNNYLEPRAVGVRHFRLESIGSTSSCPITPVSPIPPQSLTSIETDRHNNEIDQQNNFINESNNNIIVNDNSLISPPKVNAIRQIAGPVYVNVATANNNENENLNTDGNHGYANLITASSMTTICSELRQLPLTFPTEQDEKEFNNMVAATCPNDLQYIVLELENKFPPSPSPTSSSATIANDHTNNNNHSALGYTTIDFKRTWALLQTTKMKAENDVGCKRRTRHNSDAFEALR